MMGTGFSKKKKEARLMQEQLGKMQQKMSQAEVTGTAGNGLVTLTLNGEHELKTIKIKPECVDAEDIEGLQDLIKAAFNDATAKLKSQGMDGMGGMGLPDLSKFGF
jgi:DNA-binding YbaB/EbfC family protein